MNVEIGGYYITKPDKFIVKILKHNEVDGDYSYRRITTSQMLEAKPRLTADELSQNSLTRDELVKALVEQVRRNNETLVRFEQQVKDLETYDSDEDAEAAAIYGEISKSSGSPADTLARLAAYLTKRKGTNGV